MTKGYRGVLWILVLVTVLCILPTVSVGAQVPIHFWVFAQPPGVAEWLESWQDDFNAENPDIRLEIRVGQSDNEAREELVVAMAGGIAPDIHFESSNQMANWVTRQWALPLDSFLERMPDRDDLFPDVLEAVRWGGKTYGVPYAMWPIYDLYNVNVLESAGIQFPETWHEQIEMARRLTRVDGSGIAQTFGYITPERDSDVWAYIKVNHAMQQQGRIIVEPDATSTTIDRATGIRAIQYRRDLSEAGMRGGARPGWAEFWSGQIAAWQGSGFSAQNIVRAIEEGAVPVARRFAGPEPGRDSLMHNAGVLFMLSTTEHPEEAWRVMEAFIAADTVRELLLVGQRFQPARRSLIDDPLLLARPFAEDEAKLLFQPIWAYGATHPLWSHFQFAVGEPLRQAIAAEISPEAGIEESERILNVELTRWAANR